MLNLQPSDNERNANPVLPYNFLAEKMILHCLLTNNEEAMEIAFQKLPVDAFYFSNHQKIFKALHTMNQERLPINVSSVITFLQNNGLLESVGGIKVLFELISQIPNVAYIEEYVNLVQDKFIRRKLIKLGYEMINSSYVTNLPPEQILKKLETGLFNLTKQNDEETLIASSDLMNEAFLKLKDQCLTDNFSGIKSGFFMLDSMTQGFQKSDLIILAGRPSTGKTAFGLNVASNILQQTELPVLFVSLEMSKEQLIYRLLSLETNINQMKLRIGELYKDDWAKLNEAMKLFSKLPLFIDDRPNLSISEIRSQIKTLLFQQQEIGLVIIDYLQLIAKPNVTIENRSYELAKITRSLKIMAREFNIPIIALSQLNRNIENRMDKRPILSDLRESGSIEQDADLILMLANVENENAQSGSDTSLDFSNYQKIIELIIAKQRNGPTGLVHLQFNTECVKFNDFSMEN